MSTKWAGGIAVLALTMGILTGRSAADNVSRPPSPEDLTRAMIEAATPGPEHAKLQPLVGNWSYTCKCWMDPSQPPIETKGTIERKWILGGRYLEERIAGTGFDGKPGFEAFGLIGYDKNQQKYTSTLACTMSTGPSTGVGVSESSGKFTFQTTCNCPLSKTVIPGRDEIRIESEDRVVVESFKTFEGKDVKVMEIVAVRRR